MITKAEAEARVAKGAEYLDRVCPNWLSKIDVGTLTLNCSYNCIIGQIANGHSWGSLDFFAASPELSPAVTLDNDETRTWKTFHERTRDYGVLQDAWIAAIAARRHPVSEERDNERVESATATNAVREDIRQPVVSIRASSSSSDRNIVWDDGGAPSRGAEPS